MELPRLANAASAGLLLLFLSCGRDGPITIRFDVGTTSDERAAVESVIPDWNAETLPEYQIVVADDGDELVSFVDRILADGVEVEGRECTDEGRDCAREHWVRIKRGMPPTRIVWISRHEIGHILGMHHLRDDETGVMRRYDHADRITDADRSLCRAAERCPMVIGRRLK